MWRQGGHRVCISRASSPLASSTCQDPEPLWHGLSTAGWGSDPQTLWKMQLNMGWSLSSTPFFSVLQEGSLSHVARPRASPPFLVLPPAGARLRTPSQALLSSRQSQAPKYH